MTQKPFLIVVTGGGTGGHVEPLIAVIDELRKAAPHVQITWIGMKGGLEALAAHNLNVPFHAIQAGKLRRYIDWNNILDLVKVLIGYVQSLWLLLRARPKVVFSKAGYVSVPTLLAAATLRIPVVAHESDTVIGLANHIANHVAVRFFTGFPLPFYSQTFAAKTIFTGNPVRTPVQVSFDYFGLDVKEPMIYVTGASQGAQVLNEAVWGILPRLLELTQVIHPVGTSHVARAREAHDSLPKHLQKRYVFDGYFDHAKLMSCLEHVQIAVARAGANTIADLSKFGIPTILVPLPTAASNHQYVNAQYVVEHGGAVLLAQSELTPDHLFDLLYGLFKDHHKREVMAEAMRQINPPDAAVHIAREILAVAEGRR